MKHIIFTSALILASVHSVNSQVIDTVSMGPSYAKNIWYSLDNDNQASAPNNNWDLAFATTFSQTNSLTTAIHFNHKLGNVYEVAGSSVATFNTIDTAGLSTWNPLYNSELAWGGGALNNTTVLGQFDYGWGSYDAVNHTGINGNRIFVTKYNDGTILKFYVDMNFTASSYTVTSSNLDNTNLQTKVIVYTDYSTKNFVYLNTKTGTIVDREPASTTWDFLFTHYPTNDYDPAYLVTGILQNIKTEVAKVYPIGNTATYDNWSAATFSEDINSIGWNWKVLAPDYSYEIADSTVYFVKTQGGDIWKLIMTGFGGSANGNFIFSKEKIETASLNETALNPSLTIYPNPANESTTLVLDKANNATISISNSLGQVVYTSQVMGDGLQVVQIPTANWSAGFYQVATISATGKTVKKLNIQH